MNKMHILLRQLNLEDELPTLMNATIKKVTVNLDDCYRFFLQSEDCIPYEEFIRFEKGLQSFPYKASFELEVREQLYLKEELLQYAKYCMIKLASSMQQYSFIPSLPIDFEKDTLTIKVVNEIQNKTTQTFTKYLQSELSSCGFEVYVKAQIDEENDDYKKIKEEMEANPEIVMSAPIKQEEVKPVVKQPFRRPKNEYTPIRIDEIKQDVQYATIRGFISEAF